MEKCLEHHSVFRLRELSLASHFVFRHLLHLAHHHLHRPDPLHLASLSLFLFSQSQLAPPRLWLLVIGGFSRTDMYML
jgi:hypothetical protein